MGLLSGIGSIIGTGLGGPVGGWAAGKLGGLIDDKTGTTGEPKPGGFGEALTSQVNQKINGIPSAGGEQPQQTGAQAGRRQAAFNNAAYPGTNPWEQLGTGQGGIQSSIASNNNKTAVQVAKIQQKTALGVADINQNTGLLSSAQQGAQNRSGQPFQVLINEGYTPLEASFITQNGGIASATKLIGKATPAMKKLFPKLLGGAAVLGATGAAADIIKKKGSDAKTGAIPFTTDKIKVTKLPPPKQAEKDPKLKQFHQSLLKANKLAHNARTPNQKKQAESLIQNISNRMNAYIKHKSGQK